MCRIRVCVYIQRLAYWNRTSSSPCAVGSYRIAEPYSFSFPPVEGSLDIAGRSEEKKKKKIVRRDPCIVLIDCAEGEASVIYLPI